MIPELGHLALTLALAAALAQSILPIWGARTGDVGLMGSGRATAVLVAGLCAIAFGALMSAFATSDFSVLNVVENSHSMNPMIYKVAATWGSHEGSLLLWVLILSVFGGAVALLGTNLPDALRARVLSVQAWIIAAFLGFLLFTSNPFERVVPAPLDGNELNPLLQHVGLALHPPLLYLGYVGLSVVFSFAVAALIEGRVDPAWARWVRPWTLAAWMALSAGITLGAWWAYSELGWGGWWFWDPVENVSFMPWLAATALLHSAIVTEKRDAFKSWTILLAILAFSLSIFGTFIVRSGLLTSVHAFAVDPTRGLYILGLLSVSVGGAFALFAWRAPEMEPGGLFKPVSREGALLVNNLALAVAAATVLFGTVYPLILEAVGGDKITVGPPYFNATFVPVMLPLMIVAGVGPFLPWKRADLPGVLSRLKWVAALSLVAAVAIFAVRAGDGALAVVAMAIAVWLGLATLLEWSGRVRLFEDPADAWRRARALPRAAHGMTLAHLALAVMIVGMTGSSAWRQETVTAAREGTIVEASGFTLRFDGVRRVEGPNWIADEALVTVLRDGRQVTELHPQRRWYPAARQQTTESAIRSTLAGDLYATIGEPAAGGEGWTFRVIYEPFVGLIWLGGAMLVLGGGLSLSDRRLRIGAPRRSPSAPVPLPAE